MSGGTGRSLGVTIRDFQARKGRAEKLVVVSTYDALFARLADESGVDAILVGDSVGNVVSGLESTLPVTLDQMIYHGAAARRGTTRAMLIVDMPFLTYQVTEERAMLNCGRVMQETGANAVKLEGASDAVLRAVRAVVALGVPVMGHLGFTPQSVHAMGGARVQARDDAGAARLLESAGRLQDAGCFSIVLELIPGEIAARVTESLAVPTIGIGAGSRCDGQVLVLSDLLGLDDRFAPKFLKRYATLAAEARRAIGQFRDEVRQGVYPDAEHSF